MKKLLFLTFALLLTSCSSQVMVESYEAGFEQQKSVYDVEYFTGERTPIQLANLSVTKEIIDQYPELGQKRVGLGLTNRILENFEETGYFKYTEEKDDILNQMIDKWELSDAGLAVDGTELKTGGLVLPKYLAYAELYEFSTSKEEVVDKFNTMTKNTTIVGFQIRLVSVENGEFLIASGLGKTSQVGLGFFDNPSMEFDESTVGMSTQKALETATVNLISRAQRRGWLPKPE
jgi:curli biogenesis system outer membrane secretion channel CsgG